MSVWTTIECDWCESSWGEDDAPYFEEDINVSGNYYEHVCEDCWEAEVFYCEHCAVYHEAQYSAGYCEELDYIPCEDCVEEAHAGHPEWTGYCEGCDYESEDYDPSQRPGSWAKIIG